MELKDLLEFSVKQNASDLHLSPGLPPMIRINGDLVHAPNMAVLSVDETKTLIYSSMEPEQQKEFEKELELDFAVQIPNLAGFRVNAFRQIHGIAAVFRVIPEKIPTLEELNLPSVFKDLLKLPNGIILVTGPTGSGKSTTLAAMVDYINEQEECHIITIEDPIEFIHHSKKSLINQRQVHRDTHDFSIALRSALREDPDVILVGEMRDLETIRLALTAAETGHLVMATLHTSSAPRTVSRIVDVFPAGEKNIIRNLLSESLQAVICQTLVKNLSGGRTAAFEIMLGTPAIRNLIREDKVSQMLSAIQTGSSVGMRTLDQYLEDLVNQQVISQEMAAQAGARKI
ncbi:MAG: type IV pilus twitching motility protein PilT [Gammaproteobacteria bacterium]